MSKSTALTMAQREAIYQGKLNGRTLNEMAHEIGCSYECVRKWWRVGRHHGLDGLHRARCQRIPRPVLSTFDPRVAARAVHWKRQHPRRGPTRILHDLRQDEQLQDVRLPHRTQLAAYFRQACPELLQARRPRAVRPPRASHVHAVWQIDGKEDVALQDGTVATVLDVREPLAGVWLGNFAHAVQTAKAWRKLSLFEIQADLRQVFATFGLPAAIQTDREHVYGQPPSEAFPSTFTLWLVGLGVRHHFSRAHRPTDQPQVERGHRTWDDWLASPDPWPNVPQLQLGLEHARQLHATVLPSWASDCAGHPPLEVHPEVQRIQRPYQLGAERVLFRLERVDQFLAQFTWHYKVSRQGQVTLHDHLYYLGTAWAGHTVDVRFDATDRHFVFTDALTGLPVKRIAPSNLDVASITGLPDDALVPNTPVQLSFPV
jgi:hypothetical protein